MRTINEEISRIERSHDHLWSIREDLHARFDSRLKPHIVDSILDCVADGHEGNVGRFRKIFIERKAIQELELLTVSRPSHLVAGYLAA